MKQRHVTLVVMAACVSCAGPDTSASEPPAEGADTASWEPVTGTQHVTILSCEDLESTILSGPPSRAGLAEVHGAPDSTYAWVEPNRHVEGAQDSLFTVHYPGVEASFRVPQGGRDLIVHADITTNRFISDPSLGIGAAESVVVARLGEPTRREGSDLVYECGMGAEQPVTFRIRQGSVAAIRISYYVD